LFKEFYFIINFCQMTRKVVYVAVYETARPRHLLVLHLTDEFVHSPHQMAQCYKCVSDSRFLGG